MTKKLFVFTSLSAFLFLANRSVAMQEHFDRMAVGLREFSGKAAAFRGGADNFLHELLYFLDWVQPLTTEDQRRALLRSATDLVGPLGRSLDELHLAVSVLPGFLQSFLYLNANSI